MNLFALVKASPECVALLGANPVRFFEFGQAPQLEQAPYVTYQHITGSPYNVLTGPAEADHITTQVDVLKTIAMSLAGLAPIRKVKPSALSSRFSSSNFDSDHNAAPHTNRIIKNGKTYSRHQPFLD